MSKKETEPPFVMPKPKGPFVRWYPLGDKRQESCFAVVYGVAQRCIDAAALRTGDRMFTPQLACRHVDDPNVTIDDRQDAGGWDNMPETVEETAVAKMVRGMAGAIADLSGRVAALERRVRNKQPTDLPGEETE